MAESTDYSSRQIQLYIRLTNLILEILEYVDSGKMALTPAVELSYLTEKEQFYLLETIEIEDCTPSLSQAQQMKRLSQSGELNADRIFTMLTEQKPNSGRNENPDGTHSRFFRRSIPQSRSRLPL